MIEESVNRGTRAELEFIAGYKKTNPEAVIQKSTEKQDMFEHIDYFIDGKGYDIKAKKSLGMLNHLEQVYCVLEELNVNGDKGWLHGKADFIAFEISHFFVVIPRVELLDYYEANVIAEVVQDPNDAVLKKYSRGKDLMSAVPYSEIQSENCFIIRKAGYD